MKKYLPIHIQILSFLFLFSILSVNRCFAQELDFKTTIDTSKSLLKNKLNLTITIEGGVPGYKVFCMDGLMTNGGKIVAYAQKINESTYQFQKITLKEFSICVMDSKKKLLCRPEKFLKENIQQ